MQFNDKALNQRAPEKIAEYFNVNAPRCLEIVVGWTANTGVNSE